MANMTQKRYDEIEAKMEKLRHEEIPAAEKRRNIARSHGDLRENNDFDVEQTKIAVLEQTYAELERQKREASIIKYESKVKFLLDDKVIDKTLSAEGESYKDTITLDSIVGKLISKMNIGEVKTYRDIDGNKHTLKLIRKM